MTDFERLVNSGLPLTWGAILVGWQGPLLHPSVVSSKEVISYATDKIMQDLAEDRAGYVVDLASAEPSDARIIENSLRNLASFEEFNAYIETLKWEVVLLRKLLLNLSSDPVDALMELTHFWSLFDYPSDSPHTIQGMGNSITPQDYYTRENLSRILDAHYRWMETQICMLSGKEK